MKRTAAALAAAVLLAGAPAIAKTFIHDDAQMFGAATVESLNTRISNFNAQTGKEIVVQTVPSVTGGDIRGAAESAFAQQQVNGVLIFIDKGDRKDWIMPDSAAVQAGWWNSETSTSIANAMEAQFKAGDFDGGITTAVNGALNVYRSHLGSLNRNTQPSYAGRGSYAAQQSSYSGVHINMLWWIIIAIFAFFVLRSIMRAASGPRYYGGGTGAPGAPGPGAGYGGGYGPGYYGGGGGFWSGLLGGLGGAWLGNEMFGGNRGNIGGGAWGNVDPTGDAGAAPDAGGWQSDPGQAGIGGGGGGDWGGGGFGGGDFGGGGGGDFGGGGGGGSGW